MLLDHSSDKAASYCVEHDLASKADHNIKLDEAAVGQAISVQRVMSLCLCSRDTVCSVSVELLLVDELCHHAAVKSKTHLMAAPDFLHVWLHSTTTDYRTRLHK